MSLTAMWRTGRSPSPRLPSCIHCGCQVPSLFREYSASVLKETTCTHCGHVADKYIEYDPVIVLIDLLLLNKHAFLHLLHNTPFSNHWKLAVVMVLIEGYVKYDAVWAGGGGREGGGGWSNQTEVMTGFLDSGTPHLDAERLFYMICAESLLASVALFGTIFLLSWKFGLPPTQTRRVSAPLLWKAVVLGSLGVFFWVPALIWKQPGREGLDAVLVNGYVFLSLLHTLAAVCRCGRPLSAVVAGLGIAAKLCARELLRALQLSMPFQ